MTIHIMTIEEIAISDLVNAALERLLLHNGKLNEHKAIKLENLSEPDAEKRYKLAWLETCSLLRRGYKLVPDWVEYPPRFAFEPNQVRSLLGAVALALEPLVAYKKPREVSDELWSAIVEATNCLRRFVKTYNNQLKPQAEADEADSSPRPEHP